MSYYGAHNVEMNPQSDCTTPTKKQIKALYQAQRRANPVKRRLEQSSNTVQRRSARINQVVQDHESDQRAAARKVPGVCPKRVGCFGSSTRFR